MNSLITRTVSAIVALLLLGALFYFFETAGLKVAILLIVFLGGFEINKVLFSDSSIQFHRIVFPVFNILIFSLSCWKPFMAGLFYSALFILFSISAIGLFRKDSDLPNLAGIEAKAALGFFYTGLLPSFTFQIIDLPHGISWFGSLLAVVFAGDIGAYLAGSLLGQRKIMPHISPKKTYEGAIGGLLSSLLAGLLCSFWFPHISATTFCLLSAVTGVVAQFGDYFESLLKRVANVKDSGHLMPGHGGILDRIDGVLFGTPLFLLGAIALEKLS
jgi:phosphatidate cytidylyltransferase